MSNSYAWDFIITIESIHKNAAGHGTTSVLYNTVQKTKQHQQLDQIVADAFFTISQPTRTVDKWRKVWIDFLLHSEWPKMLTEWRIQIYLSFKFDIQNYEAH